MRFLWDYLLLTKAGYPLIISLESQRGGRRSLPGSSTSESVWEQTDISGVMHWFKYPVWCVGGDAIDREKKSNLWFPSVGCTTRLRNHKCRVNISHYSQIIHLGKVSHFGHFQWRFALFWHFKINFTLKTGYISQFVVKVYCSAFRKCFPLSCNIFTLPVWYFSRVVQPTDWTIGWTWQN